jgi:hypothetical protein
MQTALHVKEVTVLPDGRMDTRNAAIYAGLAEKTMAMMRCDGKGPEYIKMGKVFYFREKLDEWVRKRTMRTFE